MKRNHDPNIAGYLPLRATVGHSRLDGCLTEIETNQRDLVSWADRNHWVRYQVWRVLVGKARCATRGVFDEIAGERHGVIKLASELGIRNVDDALKEINRYATTTALDQWLHEPTWQRDHVPPVFPVSAIL